MIDFTQIVNLKIMMYQNMLMFFLPWTECQIKNFWAADLNLKITFFAVLVITQFQNIY